MKLFDLARPRLCGLLSAVVVLWAGVVHGAASPSDAVTMKSGTSWSRSDDWLTARVGAADIRVHFDIFNIPVPCSQGRPRIGYPDHPAFLPKGYVGASPPELKGSEQDVRVCAEFADRAFEVLVRWTGQLDAPATAAVRELLAELRQQVSRQAAVSQMVQLFEPAIGVLHLDRFTGTWSKITSDTDVDLAHRGIYLLAWPKEPTIFATLIRSSVPQDCVDPNLNRQGIVPRPSWVPASVRVLKAEPLAFCINLQDGTSLIGQFTSRECLDDLNPSHANVAAFLRALSSFEADPINAALVRERADRAALQARAQAAETERQAKEEERRVREEQLRIAEQARVLAEQERYFNPLSKAQDLIHQERFAEAEPYVRQALDVRPQEWSLHWLLGDVLRNRQPPDYAAATRAYRDAVVLVPDQQPALTRYLIETAQWPEAISEGRVGVEADPAHADRWADLAKALAGSGDFAGAAAALRRGLAADPGSTPSFGKVLEEYEKNAARSSSAATGTGAASLPAAMRLTSAELIHDETGLALGAVIKIKEEARHPDDGGRLAEFDDYEVLESMRSLLLPKVQALRVSLQKAASQPPVSDSLKERFSDAVSAENMLQACQTPRTEECSFISSKLESLQADLGQRLVRESQERLMRLYCDATEYWLDCIQLADAYLAGKFGRAHPRLITYYASLACKRELEQSDLAICPHCTIAGRMLLGRDPLSRVVIDRGHGAGMISIQCQLGDKDACAVAADAGIPVQSP